MPANSPLASPATIALVVAAVVLTVWLSAGPACAGELQPPLEVSSVADRPLAARSGDSLFFVVGDRITTARVSASGISGRGLALRFSGDQLHGDVAGQHVELRLRGPRIDGHLGRLEISLEVGRSDGVLKVTGRFGARAISEELSPGAVTAEVGPCRYALTFSGTEYAGQVVCGGQPEPVHLRIPATLVARGDVEIAALLTAFLAR